MKTLIAETSAREAFNELSSLCLGDWNIIDEFTLARLEKAARLGLEEDPVMAHQVLAIAAVVRWDEPTMDHHFIAAMHLDCGATAQNYATALASIGRCAEAANMYERAAQMHPTNLAPLRCAMHANWRAGRWTQALGIAKTLKLRAPDELIPDLDANERIVKLATGIGVSFELIERLHARAYAFLRERKIRPLGVESDCDDTSGDETIYVTINIAMDVEVAEQLDEELTPILLDSEDSLRLSTFCMSIDTEEATHEA